MPVRDFVEQTLRNLVAESQSFGHTRYSFYDRRAAAHSTMAFLTAAHGLGSVTAICDDLARNGVTLEWFGEQAAPLPAYVNCLPPDATATVKEARDRLRPILQALDREWALQLRARGLPLPG